MRRAAAKNPEIPLIFSIIQKFRKVLVLFPKNPKNFKYSPKIQKNSTYPQKSLKSSMCSKNPQNPQIS
jgi:hypothetical protein